MLKFSDLRKANIERLPLFKNKKGEDAHKEPDGSDWGLSQWLQAASGEFGEYANIRKKYDRGDISWEEFQEFAGQELADVVTYLDIFAYRVGLPLMDNRFFVVLGSNTTFKEFRIDRLGVNSYGLDLTDNMAAKIYLNMHKDLLTLFDICDDCITYDNHQNKMRHLRARCNVVISAIDDLCAHYEIDLGLAVKNKFNQVSGRIDCSVYL